MQFGRFLEDAVNTRVIRTYHVARWTIVVTFYCPGRNFRHLDDGLLFGFGEGELSAEYVLEGTFDLLSPWLRLKDIGSRTGDP